MSMSMEGFAGVGLSERRRVAIAEKGNDVRWCVEQCSRQAADESRSFWIRGGLFIVAVCVCVCLLNGIFRLFVGWWRGGGVEDVED